MCSHNPDYVRGDVNKAFLIGLLFYGMQCNTYLSDFVIVSETEARWALILRCNTNRTELTARMNGRDTVGECGGGGKCIL